MADNTIDSLALEISSKLAGAEKALDKLAGSLARLQKSMNLVSNSKLGGFNAAIKNLKDSLTGFSGAGNLEKRYYPDSETFQIEFRWTIEGCSWLK